MISESTAKRLAFIRYLYGVSVDQARLPEPMCAASVLAFHDTIEQFLILACEHKDIEIKASTNFMQYWKFLRPKLEPNGLSQKASMIALDKARGSLKHRGIRPSREDIQTFLYAATLFFRENTPTIFGLEFGDISMVYLVQDPAVRTDLESAEDLYKQGELQEAVGKVAVAFDRLLKSRQKRNPLLSGLKWPTSSPRPTTYKLGGSFGRSALDDYSKKMFGDILDQTDALKRAVEPMHDAMVAFVLGVGYERYQRFLRLTPRVMMLVPEGAWSPTPTPHWNHVPNYLTPEIYKFCFDFAIDAAIRVQAD